MQKDWRAGMAVVAPIPKAMKLVIEVMVMATPACLRVTPSLSTTPFFLSASLSVFRHWMMTNISSIPGEICHQNSNYDLRSSDEPIPSIRNGMTVWAGLYQKPSAEQTP